MRFVPARLVLSLALFAAACGGARGGDVGDPGTSSGPDGGVVIGAACRFDTDCAPPDYICDQVTFTCVEGCGLNPNCPPGKACNTATGRCVVSGNGGGDGGTDGGVTTGDGGVPAPVDTLCHACTVNSDCHGDGRCVANNTHSGNYCTQACTPDKQCPADYTCVGDRTGSTYQCVPTTGQCVETTTNDGGTTGGGNDGGTDPGTTPSNNPNGCGFCGQCNNNDDCVTGSVCVNGFCATGPCTQWFDCAVEGALLASCTDVGMPDKYCLPLLGMCLKLPGPLAPLSGDVDCVPSGTNPACQAASMPGASLGPNVPVTQNLNPKPLLATEDSIARDSQGRMAIGYIGVDSQGNSYMGVSQSTDDGAHWTDRGRMRATTPVQSDPVLVVSKWTDAGGAHERMHYVWVGYTLETVNGQTNPKDMFMESSYSDDGGANWSAAARATTTADTNGGTLLLDKPWVTVSNDPSQTLMLTFSVGDNTQQHMFAVTSADHGQSWGAKVPIESGDNDHGHNLGMPVFDPTDTSGNTVYVVYVTYQTVEATTSNRVELVKSTDKGQHWTGPYVVSASDDQVLFEPPSIAVDDAHHLYVGYVAAPGSVGTAGAKYWDGMVAGVDISSATPVVAHRARVSDDSGDCYQHFHVMTAVDRATGTLYAGWLDNRGGANAGGVWYSKSTDQGASFSANKRISDQPFVFNPDHQSAQLDFLGDYFGFIWDGAKLRVSWSDPRNGTESQAFYAGGAP